MNNLAIGYNKKSVYNNLNLSLKAGEAVVINGENGIGKTTLIRTLWRITSISWKYYY